MLHQRPRGARKSILRSMQTMGSSSTVNPRTLTVNGAVDDIINVKTTAAHRKELTLRNLLRKSHSMNNGMLTLFNRAADIGIRITSRATIIIRSRELSVYARFFAKIEFFVENADCTDFDSHVSVCSVLHENSECFLERDYMRESYFNCLICLSYDLDSQVGTGLRGVRGYFNGFDMHRILWKA